MKNKILYFFIVPLLIHCNKEQTKGIPVSLLQTPRLNLYKKEIIQNGNIKSFNSLETHYYNLNQYDSILPFAILMLNKYKYNEAYISIYMAYVGSKSKETNYSSIIKLNDYDKNIALYYLKTGAKLNISSCQNYLEILYRKGWGVKKNIHKADSINELIINELKANGIPPPPPSPSIIK